jgi:hypothetical protein
MEQIRSKRIDRSLRYIALVILLIGASLAFLQYAGWSAVYSGNYGLPSQISLVQESAAKGQIYFWFLLIATSAATAIAAGLLPSAQAVDSPALKLILRGTSAFGPMAAAILAIASVGQYFR